MDLQAADAVGSGGLAPDPGQVAVEVGPPRSSPLLPERRVGQEILLRIAGQPGLEQGITQQPASRPRRRADEVADPGLTRVSYAGFHLTGRQLDAAGSW